MLRRMTSVVLIMLVFVLLFLVLTGNQSMIAPVLMTPSSTSIILLTTYWPNTYLCVVLSLSHPGPTTFCVSSNAAGRKHCDIIAGVVHNFRSRSLIALAMPTVCTTVSCIDGMLFVRSHLFEETLKDFGPSSIPSVRRLVCQCLLILVNDTPARSWISVSCLLSISRVPSMTPWPLPFKSLLQPNTLQIMHLIFMHLILTNKPFSLH